MCTGGLIRGPVFRTLQHPSRGCLVTAVGAPSRPRPTSPRAGRGLWSPRTWRRSLTRPGRSAPPALPEQRAFPRPVSSHATPRAVLFSTGQKTRGHTVNPVSLGYVQGVGPWSSVPFQTGHRALHGVGRQQPQFPRDRARSSDIYRCKSLRNFPPEASFKVWVSAFCFLRTNMSGGLISLRFPVFFELRQTSSRLT